MRETSVREVTMKKRIAILRLFFISAIFLLYAGQSLAADYAATIQYKQTMVRVLRESDVQGWPSGLPTTPRYPEFITVSADGSKVGFTVKLNIYSDMHIYVMNSDGTGLTDLTDNLPAGVSVGTPQLNEDGSRLFCWDYGNGNIYYFDTTSPYDIHPAYKPDAFWAPSKRNYSLNSDGTVIYLIHSWKVDTVDHYGLVSTVVGSNALTPVVDAASLTPPKTAHYDLRFLDAARIGGRLLLTYYPDYYHDNLKVMWETDPLQPMPNESHYMIWDNSATSLQYCHIMSADGSKVLYNFQDTGSRPEIHLLNLNTGEKTLLFQLVDGLDTMQFPALSPDGTVARWTSGGYKATRRIIATGDMRDTHSARFPESSSIGNSSVTDITSDNRYYFMGGGNAGVSYMHRIDMAPAITAPAPDIVSISFGQSQLVFGDTTPIPITVQVSDPKGVENIVSVQMSTLVDGRESPYGQIYEPLIYINPLTGSSGVYSGTVYPQIYSSIYNQLPRSVGVRIVVKNKDEHYVLADTAITVVQPGTNELSVTPSNRDVAKDAGTTTFGVSNTGTGTMQWTAAVTSASSWLSIKSGSSGTNAGTITCAFNANAGTSTRTGTIRVTATGATGSPKDVTITQAGASAQPSTKVLGAWTDGVWAWDNATNKWTRLASTSNAWMIAAGRVDTDSIDDLIGVWSSGLYVRQSTNGLWIRMSTSLPIWIAAGDLNNDGRDDVVGSWRNSGVYYRDSATGNWFWLCSAANQLAAGNIGGTRDDLAGVWTDGLWVRYSANASWQKIDAAIPLWITVGDMTGDSRADIVGSYGNGTWYRNSATKGWFKITTPAEQLASGDLDSDGRDDLVGIWSNRVYVRYAATGLWQLISTSKPRWITTGRIAVDALVSADFPASPEGMNFVDLSDEDIQVMESDDDFFEKYVP
jgi:hypothetical protein